MGTLVQPGFITVALAAVMAGAVLVCLRVVAGALAGAVARYDLRVHAARLRLEQSVRLRELTARAQRGSSRRRSPVPSGDRAAGAEHVAEVIDAGQSPMKQAA